MEDSQETKKPNTSLFTNFSDEDFEGQWDGKKRVFKAGESQYMPSYLAEHFAKHLTNRELLKAGHERSTSPKNPDDVPEFMELFNKAVTPDTDEEFIEESGNDIDTQINITNKNRKMKAQRAKKEGKEDPTPEPAKEEAVVEEPAKAKAPVSSEEEMVTKTDFDEDDD